ncbi:MAG: hypothetical protein D6795_05165, partial [Deltaproteobacteria bacterium]
MTFPRRECFFFLAVVGFALLLRLGGIDFGLHKGVFWHPEEWETPSPFPLCRLERALIDRALFHAHRLLFDAVPPASYRTFLEGRTPLRLRAYRLASAFLGASSVAFLGWMAWRSGFSPIAAALFLAISPLHLHASHLATPETLRGLLWLCLYGVCAFRFHDRLLVPLLGGILLPLPLSWLALLFVPLLFREGWRPLVGVLLGGGVVVGCRYLAGIPLSGLPAPLPPSGTSSLLAEGVYGAGPLLLALPWLFLGGGGERRGCLWIYRLVLCADLGWAIYRGGRPGVWRCWQPLLLFVGLREVFRGLRPRLRIPVLLLMGLFQLSGAMAVIRGFLLPDPRVAAERWRAANFTAEAPFLEVSPLPLGRKRASVPQAGGRAGGVDAAYAVVIDFHARGNALARGEDFPPPLRFAFPIVHFPRRGWPRSMADRLAPLLYLSPVVTIYRLLPHEVGEAGNTTGWFEHAGGFAWRMRIAPTYARYDDRVASAPARLFLYEDGVPLGPRMALHEEIRRKGRGRYSHWGDTLIFS